jgi:hypothetical protein
MNMPRLLLITATVIVFGVLDLHAHRYSNKPESFLIAALPGWRSTAGSGKTVSDCSIPVIDRHRTGKIG